MTFSTPETIKTVLLSLVLMGYSLTSYAFVHTVNVTLPMTLSGTVDLSPTSGSIVPIGADAIRVLFNDGYAIQTTMPVPAAGASNIFHVRFTGSSDVPDLAASDPAALINPPPGSLILASILTAVETASATNRLYNMRVAPGETLSAGTIFFGFQYTLDSAFTEERTINNVRLTNNFTTNGKPIVLVPHHIGSLSLVSLLVLGWCALRKTKTTMLSKNVGV